MSGQPFSAKARLLWTQVKHDLQLKYLGSVAGVFWAVLNPMIQVGIYVLLVIFVLEARLGAAEGGRFAYVVFLLSGLSPWLALQEGMIGGATSIVRHGGIVKNVVFPTELLPISGVLTSLVSLAISLLAVFVLLLIGGGSVSVTWLALLIVIPLQVGFTVGLALLLAPVNTFLRDVALILPVTMQVLMLATPVVYGLSDMPGTLQQVTHFNPLFQLVDAYREPLLHGRWPSLRGLGYVTLWATGLLLVGGWLFRKTKGYFEAVV